MERKWEYYHIIIFPKWNIYAKGKFYFVKHILDKGHKMKNIIGEKDVVPSWERTGECLRAPIGLKMKEKQELWASIVAFIGCSAWKLLVLFDFQAYRCSVEVSNPFWVSAATFSPIYPFILFSAFQVFLYGNETHGRHDGNFALQR